MVSVNLILRENLIEKAQYAKSEYEAAAKNEAESLNFFETELNKIIPGTGESTGGDSENTTDGSDTGNTDTPIVSGSTNTNNPKTIEVGDVWTNIDLSELSNPTTGIANVANLGGLEIEVKNNETSEYWLIGRNSYRWTYYIYDIL